VFVTSLYAAAATAAALWHVEAAHVSHVLDVSTQECIAHSLQNAIQVYDLEGRIARRGGEGTRDATEGAFVCKDGYVFVAAPLTLSSSWTRLLDWMTDEGFGPAERLRDPEWSDRNLRATEPFRRAFRDIFEAFVAGRTREELGAIALGRRLVMAPVNRIADLDADPQLIFRRYFRKVPIPGLGREVVFPGAPYRLSEPVWKIERGPPELGADSARVLGERAGGRVAAKA
jgi:benzylsuccinate CoA-transferase BbsE subunit